MPALVPNLPVIGKPTYLLISTMYCYLEIHSFYLIFVKFARLYTKLTLLTTCKGSEGNVDDIFVHRKPLLIVKIP